MEGMRLRSVIAPGIAAVVVAVVALAFGKSRPAVSSAPASAAHATAVVSGKDVTLKIANYSYHPPALTVKAGTKIIVTNSDQTAHTVTAKSGAFDSGTVNPGKSASFTVSKPGVYHYYCQFHAFMTGTITVVK